MSRSDGGEAARRALRLHLVCERDVGLFSLIQQVIAHIPWAARAGRTPIVCFGDRCCYWVPGGHRGRSSVWEYYFEPLDARHPADSLAPEIRAALARRPPDPREVGYRLDETTWVSNHFGDHPQLAGRTLSIPYGWRDPDPALRARAAELIREHIRPRDYVLQAVDRFWDEHMAGHRVVGVHIRGTDAVSREEDRAHRKGSLALERFGQAVAPLLAPGVRVLVATDDERSLAYMARVFGDRVISHGSQRHDGGQVAGRGPTGALMPAYVARDRRAAALNGEDAVIEHLLLARCSVLVHNGSSLARTVLLQNPLLPHVNTHRKSRVLAHVQTLSAGKLRRTARRALRRAAAALRGPSPDV